MNQPKTKRVPLVVPNTNRVLMAAQPEDGRGNNDFCLWQDDNGLWHIFAITWFHAATPAKARKWLSHATAPDLLGPWTRRPYLLLSETNNWAPHIIRDASDPGKVLMFLGGMAHDTLRCYEADAKNLDVWTLRHDFGQLLGTRDPMLLYVPDEKLYYMYTTYTTQINGNVGVGVCTSADLQNWSLRHLIYCAPGETVDESPFVVYRDGYYYLWATWSSRSFYQGIPTRVFRSETPDFAGIPTTAKEHCISEIPLHAVEVQTHNGQDYICQTGTGGPGIVCNRLRWGKDGTDTEIPYTALATTGQWVFDGSTFLTAECGASASYAFDGFRVQIVGDRSMLGGYADIYIDGEKADTANFYGVDAEDFLEQYPNAFLWCSDDLAPGRHEIKVVATGARDTSALDMRIFVNKLIVTN